MTPKTPSEPPNSQATNALPLLTKVIYGTGDWGIASYNTIRQFFYAIFLTDVVGLDPGLAAFAALFAIIWDALNDPIIGALSDRINTRWGRRRPFLVLFAIPFGLAFLLLWWAPPWQSQAALMIHITLAYMLADTLQTLISVPFYALTPQLTEDYDERTTLSTFRMLFNLLASIATAVAAPEIVARAPTPQQGYLLMGAIFGGIGIVPYFAIAAVTREHDDHSPLPAADLRQALNAAWQNIPFRIATTINLLNWITVDLVALMLPFFLRYWVESGTQYRKLTLPIIGTVTIEAVIFFILLATATISLPFWTYLAKRWNKRNAYITGMLFWVVVQFLIITIRPHQETYILILTFLAGISVSTAHVLPDALFPDVLEWDELRTGQRHDGLYYGLKTFIRKITGAVAIFIALKTMDIFGYQSPPIGALLFSQQPQTLLAIRVLTGPVGSILLTGAVITAFFYPMSREKHGRIRRLLTTRRARQMQAALVESQEQ